MELDPARSALAAEHLRATDLRRHVELRMGDAGEVLGETRDDGADFVFLDAERPAYRELLAGPAAGCSRPGASCSSTTSSRTPARWRRFRELVAATRPWSSALVPLGAGVLIVARALAAPAGAAQQHLVAGHLDAEPAGDAGDRPLEPGIVEGDERAAALADEMVVMVLAAGRAGS